MTTEDAAPEGWARTVEHALTIWINPEIERRRAAGELTADFTLAMAQVLFSPPPRDEIVVRLNGEVRGFAHARATREIEAGSAVRIDDISAIEHFELDASELDYGHFTMFRVANAAWSLSFNFQRGTASARRTVERAREFFGAAKLSYEHAMPHAALDNLLSASELAAKAFLMMHVSPAVHTKRHGPLHSAIAIPPDAGSPTKSSLLPTTG